MTFKGTQPVKDFYTEETLPRPYLKVIGNPRLPHEPENAYLVTSFQNDQEQVEKVIQWIKDNCPTHRHYQGALLSVTVLPKDQAAILRLTIPL